MKSLSISKNEFLLDAPLEILHQQTLEWMEEIRFLDDEAAFLYGLIRKKILPVSAIPEMDIARNHLIELSTERSDGLKHELQHQERLLSKLMEEHKPDEQSYRSGHKEIAGKVMSFVIEFKELKKKIFLLARKEGFA